MRVSKRTRKQAKASLWRMWACGARRSSMRMGIRERLARAHLQPASSVLTGLGLRFIRAVAEEAEEEAEGHSGLWPN